MADRLVLAYHALSPTWPAPLSIEPERFEHQVRALAERGYVSVRFTELVTSPTEQDRVAFTFDDGFRSVVEHALPILNRHGFVATVFVPSAYLERPGPLDWPRLNRWLGTPHEHELAPMCWKDLRALLEVGWEVGSHTCTHPYLVGLDEHRLADELTTSRQTLERGLREPCRSLAYPYGAVDRAVMRAVRRAGYLAAAALPARIHRAHRLRWPRVEIGQDEPDRVFDTKLSPAGRRRLDICTGRVSPLPRWRIGKL